MSIFRYIPWNISSIYTVTNIVATAMAISWKECIVLYVMYIYVYVYVHPCRVTICGTRVLMCTKPRGRNHHTWESERDNEWDIRHLRKGRRQKPLVVPYVSAHANRSNSFLCIVFIFEWTLALFILISLHLIYHTRFDNVYILCIEFRKGKLSEILCVSRLM